MMVDKDVKRYGAILGAAAALAAGFEGLRQYAYYDPRPGDAILTVCYGSTTQVQKGKKYSLDECRERLDNDMLDAISAVDRCVPGLPDHVLAAFGDAVYNIGPRIACDTSRSTAARLLKAGKTSEACRELPKWNKANVGGRMVALPGLTTRRAAEMTVCLGDNHANP